MPKAKAKPKATNKRRRYTESDKETAIELYMTLGNYTAVSEKLSIPVTTIKQWCYGLKKEDPDGYDDLRRKNMEKFAEDAERVITSILGVVSERVDFAAEAHTLSRKILDAIDEGRYEDAEVLKMKLSVMPYVKLSELTTALGTIYDKKALVRGESTDNVKVAVLLPEEVDDYAG